jgi:hypothetical protein
VEIDTIVAKNAIRPPRRTRIPRAAYIIPGGKSGLRAKRGGGTTESTPGANSKEATMVIVEIAARARRTNENRAVRIWLYYAAKEVSMDPNSEKSGGRSLSRKARSQTIFQFRAAR